MNEAAQESTDSSFGGYGCPLSQSREFISYPLPRSCTFDPPTEYKRLRAEQPVAPVKLWNGEYAWLISRYDDFRKVLTDPRFSADNNLPGFPVQSAALNVSRKRYPAFVSMDPPVHTTQRRMIAGEFSIKRIEQMRPKIQKMVDGLIDAMIEKGPPVDFIENFALALPSQVICELLGVPYSDHEFFQRRSQIITSNTTTSEEVVLATRELTDEFLGDLIKKKDAKPQDDLLSRLVVNHLRTGHLNLHQVISIARMVLVAGHETGANMLGMSTLLLLVHLDQLCALRDNPSLVDGAIEELFRYLSVVHSGQRRVATQDVEVAGQLIRAGEGIIAFIPSANRDESAFSDPDRFDIRRDSRNQVGFGYGVHGCLGQPLARVELQVMLRTLFLRLPGLRLTAPVESLKFKNDMLVYGVEHLPVAW